MSVCDPTISRRDFIALLAVCSSTVVIPKADELPVSVSLGSTRLDSSFMGDFYKGYSADDCVIIKELSHLSVGDRILLTDDGCGLDGVIFPICRIVLPGGVSNTGILDPPKGGLDPVAVELLRSGYSAYGEISKVEITDIDGCYPNCMCLFSFWLDVGIDVS